MAGHSALAVLAREHRTREKEDQNRQHHPARVSPDSIVTSVRIGLPHLKVSAEHKLFLFRCSAEQEGLTASLPSSSMHFAFSP
eukprot:4973143-Pleurochrysis_carterae.AAC.1